MNLFRGRPRAVAGGAAAFAGHLLRIARKVGLAGFTGAGLVSYGTALIYLPAGLIVAGLFCLVLDGRL